ncbi:MAG: ResB-like family cytochrome C biogenesis protein [Nitrospirae bacterium]|nr:ResB-like family cytochrome C biogenesis protein [Nitrospirota bacterium]
MKRGLLWIYDYLLSRSLMMILLPLLCLMLMTTTFTEEAGAVLWNIIRALLALMVINLALCTLRRIKTLSAPALIMHIGVFASFIGGGISAFGFVATVNVYEGDSTENVYRWDLKRDVPLGVEINVKKLNEEYYPVPLKIGVLRDGEKIRLFTLKTGEKFALENYLIQVDSLDIKSQSMKLSIFNGDNYIGYTDTTGVIQMSEHFPYEFKLVSYMDPVIKKTWVDLVLSKGGKIVAEGRTEVNSPLEWQGLKFYHTATSRDLYGNPFIGIQITRDPGTPVTYFGFCLVGIGGTIYFFRKIRT